MPADPPLRQRAPGDAPDAAAQRAFDALVSSILRHDPRCADTLPQSFPAILSMRFQGKTPFLLAAETGNAGACKSCIEPGWIWQRDSEGCGALLLAARRGHAGVFFELLVRACGEQGPEWAAREGRKILKKLKRSPMSQKIIAPLESAVEKFQIQCHAALPGPAACARPKPSL